MIGVLSVPTAVDAQDVSLRGRVVAVIGGDSLPVTGEWVLLHEVTAAGGRAIDSARTGSDGGYSVRIASRDTAAVYLTSVLFRDIAYFSTPVTAGPTIAPLVVFDTTSAGPPITVAERHIIVRGQEDDGSRDVLELVILENGTDRTRIAPDSSRPVWQQRLPDDVFDFEVAPNDLSPDAVYRRGDAVALLAAIPPGASNRKQLIFGYSLPQSLRTFRIPVDGSVGRLQVLIEDPAVRMVGDGLQAMGVERMENIEFQRFEARQLAAGANVRFRFAGGGLSATAVLLMGLSVTGLIMIAVLATWWRRPIRVAAPADDTDALAARIAALDERHAAASAADRVGYERERAALKAQLLRALAEPKPKR